MKRAAPIKTTSNEMLDESKPLRLSRAHIISVSRNEIVANQCEVAATKMRWAAYAEDIAAWMISISTAAR